MNKVFLLGLDGGTWDILNLGISKGILPNFEKIIKKGSAGVLKSTIPCSTIPALPALFTGKNPGNLGVFGLKGHAGASVSLKNVEDLKIWDILNTYNYTSCVVNVSHAYPPIRINGIFVSGQPIPDPDSEFTFPQHLKKELPDFTVYDTGTKWQEWIKITTHPKDNKENILKYLIEKVDNKYRYFKNLSCKAEFVFLLFWIAGTDSIQHWLWGDNDTILKYYQHLDSILADIQKRFSDYTLLVISDHGFEEAHRYKFFVNSWLRNEGFLYTKGNKIINSLRDVAIKTLFPYRQTIKKIMDRLFYFESSLKNKAVDFSKIALPLDWNRSLAYGKESWGIRIVKDKVKNYEELRDNIMEKLRNLRDHSGNVIFKDIFRREDVFRGKYLDQVPDIVFLTTPKYNVSVVDPESYFSSNRIFGLRTDDFQRKRLFYGEHFNAVDGIFIACGESIEENFELKHSPNIIDIAPTILHLIGCAIPDDLDGKVLMNLFRKGSEPRRRAIEKQAPNFFTKPVAPRDLSKKEQEEIIEKLKGMGYF